MMEEWSDGGFFCFVFFKETTDIKEVEQLSADLNSDLNSDSLSSINICVWEWLHLLYNPLKQQQIERELWRVDLFKSKNTQTLCEVDMIICFR